MDPTYIEQDHPSSEERNELPTYDDLAAQNGPNSRSDYSMRSKSEEISDSANQYRFGRWREWIEKRCGHEKKLGRVISNSTQSSGTLCRYYAGRAHA